MDSYQVDEDEQINSNSRLGKLILKVNNMQKKPLLDNSLSEVLDAFLEKLKQSENFLINGIFQINFAEAALLLQGSSFLYCKKVDLLWDTINQCQKRMIAFESEENKLELQRLEERENTYKRRRKVLEIVYIQRDHSNIENFNTDWNEVNEFQHLNYERDMRLFAGWNKKMVVNWGLQPIYKESRSFVEKYSQFRSTNNAIYDRDHDDDFVVHTSKLESAMSLENLFLEQTPSYGKFSFEIYTELYLIPNFLHYHQLKYDDLEKYTYKLEDLVSSYRDRLLAVSNMNTMSIKSSSPELQQTPQKLRRISITSTVLPKLSKADFDKIYSQECQVNLLRLSVDDVIKLCRLSIDEVRSSCEAEKPEQVSNNANFQASSSADNKVNIDADSTSCTTNVTNIQNDEHCNEDVASSYVVQSSPDRADDINDTFDSSSVNLNNESSHLSEISIQKCRVSTRKRDISLEVYDCLHNTDVIEEYSPKKRRRLSKAAIKKLATGITVDLKEFSLFFAAHYNAEEGEGKVEIPEFDIDDPIDSSSRIDPDEDIRMSQLSENRLCTQDSGYESRFHEDDDVDLEFQSPVTPLVPTDADVELEIHNEPGTSNQRCSESKVRLVEVGYDLPNDEMPLHEKVYEWKQHISEVLKHRTSKDFDIHEYGSNIMRCLDGDGPKKFGEIVQGKSSAEVTRYFISALQLANTSNVEIVGVRSGELSNETFGLNLLTTDRYYERLNCYVAPSEENYHRRLESARRLNQSHAGPSGSGIGHKRARYA